MANKFADPNEPLQYPGVMKTYPGMVKGQPPVYGKSLFGTYYIWTYIGGAIHILNN